MRAKKYKAVSFRITQDRFSELKKVAERHGMSPGVLARVAVFEVLAKSSILGKTEENGREL